MTIDRRSLIATGAGLGLSGLAAASADAGPRDPSFVGHGGASVSLQPGTERSQTAAIQTAIDRAAETGAPVVLPPGRFVCGALTLRSGTKLVGAHGATSLIARDPEPLVNCRGVRDIRIEGLRLDGQSFAESLVRLEGCEGTVSDCRIDGARGSGIFCLDGTRVLIAFNRIENCANNGIQVWRSAPGSDGARIVSNVVTGIAAQGGGSGQNGNGINVFRAGDVLVSGNSISQCTYSAVRGNAASKLQVINNNCRELGEVAIYAEFGFEGAIIAQNVIDRAATGIAVTNFNEGGRLAIVQGNLVRRLKRRKHEPVDKRGDGIAVEADTVVSGNVIEEAEATGLSIGWGPYMRQVIATANIIRSCDVGIGVTADERAGACLVNGNMISGAKRGAIRRFDHDRLIGSELVLQETVTGRVRLSGNMAD